MEDAFTRRPHATTPPGAALAEHGGRARTDRPKRHRHSTTARCARAALCTPRWMRCNAVLPLQIIIAATLQIFAPHHQLCTLRGCTCRASASTLACNRRAIHRRRPGLAALLLALLHAHLTALHSLQLAAQRHPQATLPARQDFGERVCARVPLRHPAPFGTCNAHASEATAPSTTPPSSCSHSESITTDIRGIRPRHLRADHLPPHDLCARFRARVPRLLMRARGLLPPARQQTPHTISGSLLHGSHHPPHPPSCSASAR